MSPDTVHLDLEDNEEVSEMFAGCTPGQSVTLTLEVTINEHSDDRLSASIDGVESVNKGEDYEEEDDSGEVEEVEDVMAVIKGA